MSRHFKQRQSRRIDLLIEQEKAEARLKCEKLITSRHGKETTRQACINLILANVGAAGLQAAINTPQEELGDKTIAELLQDAPEKLHAALLLKYTACKPAQRKKQGETSRLLAILDQLERRVH